MQFRVTLQSRGNMIKNSVQARAHDVMESQEIVSTGRKLLRPSDNPVAARHALLNRALLAQIQQFKSNIEFGRSDLNAADSFLSGVEKIVNRAKEIALNLGSDIHGAASRKAGAVEVTALLDEVVAQANGQFRGRHLFGGEATTVAPFALTGNNVTYGGTETGQQRRISTDVPLVETTIPGKMAFGDPSGASVFTSLRNLKTALEGNDTNGILNTVTSLNTDLNRVLEARATVGSRASRLDQTESRLEDFAGEISALQARVEDADLADSISDLTLRQTALQATLGVAGQIMPMSLMDFLR